MTKYCLFHKLILTSYFNLKGYLIIDQIDQELQGLEGLSLSSHNLGSSLVFIEKRIVQLRFFQVLHVQKTKLSDILK